MSLFEEWKALAYNENQPQQDIQNFWNTYFMTEKNIYESLLSEKSVVSGTVEELAKKYGVEPVIMAGFMDGINDSLKNPNADLDSLEANTTVSLDYDQELLYKNMVDAKADWLYELPQWDEILDAEKKKALYKEAKNLHTIRNDKKVGRNDPCPCGSGKKYKFCCAKKS